MANSDEIKMLEIYAVLTIAKLRKDDGLRINVTNNFMQQAPPPDPPARNPLEILCEAALADAAGVGARPSRRPRMRFTHLEREWMIELAEGLGWKWRRGSGHEAAGVRVVRFCAERPGKVSVRQFVKWMGRNRKNYQRARPGQSNK